MNRFKNSIRIFMGLIVIIFIIRTTWFEYRVNKNNNLVEFRSPVGQELFILGTFHNEHFNKRYHYSMQDIVTCIQNIKPDVVFIESREKIYKDYGIVDGPIDMILTYSYCMESNIPVKMIDWLEVSNENKPNTTNEKRDDNIYANIIKKLQETNGQKRILIVCGSTHRVEQSKRFLRDGFEKIDIKNKQSYFMSHTKNFTYPKTMKNVIERKIGYLEKEFLIEIDKNISNTQIKQYWYKKSSDLVVTLKETLEKIKT